MEIPRHWRLKAQRYRLEGSTCPTCGQLSFPPRPLCPYCAIQSAWIMGRALPVLLTSTGLADIKSHMKYQISEKMIR